MTDLDFISPGVLSEDAVVIVGKGITNPKLSPVSHCGIKMRQNVLLSSRKRKNRFRRTF